MNDDYYKERYGEFADLAKRADEDKKLHPEKYDRHRRFTTHEGEFTLTPPQEKSDKE